MTDHFPSERPGARVSGAEFHLGPQLCGVATAESPAQIKRAAQFSRRRKCWDATGAREERTPTPGGRVCGLRAFHLRKAALADQTGLRGGGAAEHGPLWLGHRWGTCLESEGGLLEGNSVGILSVCARVGA